LANNGVPSFENSKGIRSHSYGFKEQSESLAKPKVGGPGSLASKLPKPPSLLKQPKKRGGNSPSRERAPSSKRINTKSSRAPDILNV
jgi:hypothetical protein